MNLPSSNNGTVFINFGDNEVCSQNGKAAADGLEQTRSSCLADGNIALQSLIHIGVKGAGNIVQRIRYTLRNLIEQTRFP